MSHNYPSFVWKASSALGIPTFTTHRVQLEARIEKLLQGCLLSPLVSGNASHWELDEESVTYQMVLACAAARQGYDLYGVPGLFVQSLHVTQLNVPSVDGSFYN